MTTPIYNPPVPCLQPISGGFSAGRMVRIQGTVSSTAMRFAVNLQCGPNTNPRDDIALHLNPRFSEGVTVINSLINLQWGQEDRQNIMPLARGQRFEILILCEPVSYKIAINGQHYAEFQHRISTSRVTHLAVDGEIDLSLIQFEGSAFIGTPYAPPPGGTNMYYPSSPVPGVPSVGTAQPPMTVPYPVQSLAGYPTQPTLPYPAPSSVPYSTQTSPYPPQPYPIGGVPQPVPAGYTYQPYGNQMYTYPAPQKGTGLGGMIDKARTAVTGALASTGVMGTKHGSGMGGAMLGGAALGTGMAGAAVMGAGSKKSRKAQKKALKYGIPLAGAGVGAYALHKGFKHGFHSGSSSSSSSSSEEE